MRPLLATECISPAIDRTKLILFSPFRKGRTWKLCATAYVCRMGTLYLPFPFLYLVFIPILLRHKGTAAVAALCAVILGFTALWTWVFHLCSRLQFAFFDIVVNRGQFVAPAWRKYRPQALRWTGLKILIGLILTLLTAIPIAAFVRHLIPIFEAMPKPGQGQAPNPQLAVAILGIYAAYFGVILVFGIVYLIFSLLSDFLVPSLALENASLKEAFRRMVELVRGEPGQFALYTLLKVLLGFVGYMGAVLAWEIAFFLVTLIVGGIVFLIGYLLHLAGIPHIILLVLGILAAIAWYAAAMLSMHWSPSVLPGSLPTPRRLRPLLPRWPLPPAWRPARPIHAAAPAESLLCLSRSALIPTSVILTEEPGARHLASEMWVQRASDPISKTPRTSL